jgi:hypothetical protein
MLIHVMLQKMSYIKVLLSKWPKEALTFWKDKEKFIVVTWGIHVAYCAVSRLLFEENKKLNYGVNAFASALYGAWDFHMVFNFTTKSCRLVTEVMSLVMDGLVPDRAANVSSFHYDPGTHPLCCQSVSRADSPRWACTILNLHIACRR